MLGANTTRLPRKSPHLLRDWNAVVRVALRASCWPALIALLLACAGPSATADARRLLRVARPEDAASRLRAGLSAHPEDVEARRLLIRVYGSSHDLPAAQLHRDALRTQLPAGNPLPDLEYAHACELAKQFDAALAAYDAAAERAPQDPRGWIEGGQRAAKWGEFEAAEPRLTQGLARAPNDAASWHLLGVVRMKLGDVAGAEQAYRRGAALDGRRDNRSWIGLATIAVVRKEALQVIALYTYLVDVQPEFAAGWLGLAYGHALNHDKSGVEAALSRATALGASNMYSSRIRGLLESSGPPAPAANAGLPAPTAAPTPAPTAEPVPSP
jgi:tetratricopeptide (TPR) repeat protein